MGSFVKRNECDLSDASVSISVWSFGGFTSSSRLERGISGSGAGKSTLGGWVLIRANSKCEMRVVTDPDGAAEEEEEPPLHGVVKCDVVWYVYH